MGKIRVKTFGNEEEEKKQQQKLKRKKEAKKASAKREEDKEEIKSVDITEPTTQENIEGSETSEEPKKEKKEEVVEKKMSKAKSASLGEQKEFHSQKYQQIAKLVDKTKTYSLSEALEMLEKLQRKSFDETVELHINTPSTGISGSVTLPNGTGKKTRVAVADDKLIAEIEKGIINFDILVATPDMMPKLARIAKDLGPKGLMPNPKNGTITQNPEEVAKKYEGGQINFKTEAKSPIMHLTVGKMSFGKEKLSQNIETFINAIKKQNITNITLKSTMSPGIKINI